MPAHRTRDAQSRPALEVTTDNQLLTALTITNPAHSFPPPHTATDVPFSPPSPLEYGGDPSSTVTTSFPFPPPPPLDPSHPLSPTSPASTSSNPSLPPTPRTTTSYSRRRKSSNAADANERRPKKGDEDYIKRPENAFILFRRKCVEDRQALLQEQEATLAATTTEGSAIPKKQRQAELSKTISQQWKLLSAEERSRWEELAKQRKKEHEQMYPDYVYRPQRTKDKDRKKGKSKARKTEAEAEAESSEVKFSLPVPQDAAVAPPPQPVSPSTARRSQSAPTPPQHSVHLPHVLNPSCPTSPSLLTTTPRRLPYPPPEAPSTTHTEWVPQNTLYQPPFSYPGEFVPSAFDYDKFFEGIYLPNEPIQEQSESSSGLTVPSDPSSFMMPPPLLSGTDYMSTACDPNLLSPIDSFGSSGSHNNQFAQPQQQQSWQSFAPESQDSSILQLQQAQCAASSWEESSMSLWPHQQSASLSSDDFDLNAIPQIELGVPKFDGEVPMSDGSSGSLSLFTEGYQWDVGQVPDEMQMQMPSYPTSMGGGDPFFSFFAPYPDSVVTDGF